MSNEGDTVAGFYAARSGEQKGALPRNDVQLVLEALAAINYNMEDVPGPDGLFSTVAVDIRDLEMDEFMSDAFKNIESARVKAALKRFVKRIKDEDSGALSAPPPSASAPVAPTPAAPAAAPPSVSAPAAAPAAPPRPPTATMPAEPAGDARLNPSAAPRKPAPAEPTARPPPPVEEYEETIELKALQIMTPIAQKESGRNSTDTKGDSPSNEVHINEENVTYIVEAIMEERELSDMEIAIVSVMGKYRSGKSFLLNILAQYFLWLERHQDYLEKNPRPYGEELPDKERYRFSNKTSSSWLPEWLPDEIPTPFAVDASSDSQTCTMGLWILNKPFFLKNPHTGRKTALLLVDSQGADDGELDEAQSRAILGITTVCSSVVIYNVKSPLDVKHVKDLGDLANIFQVSISEIKNLKSADPDTDYCFGKLYFLIRDAKFDEGATIAQCRSKLMSNTDNKLDADKVQNHKDLVAQLYETFKPLERFGLPYPGTQADLVQGTTTNKMSDLSDCFLKLLDEFVRYSFEGPDFPAPVRKATSDKVLTARELYDYLDSIKTAFADCLVKGGDPQIVAMHKEEIAQDDFKKKVDEISPAGRTDFPKEELDQAMARAVQDFEASLRGMGMDGEGMDRWIRKFSDWMVYYQSTYQVEYQMRQSHGDRALAAVGAGAAVSMTPIGGFILHHQMAMYAIGAAVPIVGYYRHANDHHFPLASGEAAHSFAATVADRSLDISRATLRAGRKAMNMVGTAANQGPAIANAASGGSLGRGT